MAGRIPDETLQTIRERISLVEVVSSYVHLKKAGRNYLGLCPFHSEKTPSFTVNEERGLFHCFGCQAGGTVFTFVMRIERIEFPEAVEQLARRAGVELPKREDDAAAMQRERLYDVNRKAAEFFARALSGAAGSAARRYLAERGVHAETAERYRLGFAPPGGTALASYLEREGVPRQMGLDLGLLGRRGDGTVYDRFRGRLMFPIRDRRERVIAFGGRTLGADQPKYLNSPESLLFRKGEGLYGLAEAREAIRDSARVVLVEGYMDVLLLVQGGVPYTVAVLGTALTASQLRLLRPFGGDQVNVLFFFDGDRAGRAAAVRAFAVCAEAEVWGRAVFLPEGFDPDSFVRQHGSAVTLQRLETAVPLADVYLDSVVRPGASLPERARAVEEVARTLARVRGDVRFELLCRQAATHLGVGEDVFRRVRSGQADAPRAARPAAAPKYPAAELLLVEMIAADAAVARWAATRQVLARFTDRDLASSGERLVAAHAAGESIGAALDSLPEALSRHLTARLLDDGPMADADRMKVAEDCAARVERSAQQEKRRRMAAELRRAEDRGDAQQSLEKLADLNELLRREGGAA